MPHIAGKRYPVPLLALSLSLCAGCSDGPARHVPSAARWTVGCTQPAFDPDGPPDAVRAALERTLSRGLLERRSDGSIVLGAAERFAWGKDSLSLTFVLRPGLHFTDGTAVTSQQFRAALIAGLARADHGTRAWLLGAVEGVAQVRAGRPLPALGIETPDARTLVLRLVRKDSHLLDALAIAGVSTPWKSRVGEWDAAVGIGPYRVAEHEPGRALVLLAADSSVGVAASLDTLRIGFVVGAARVRTLLRRGATDLVWPIPPALLERAVPAPYVVQHLEASPPRRLLLVFRADMPPMHRLPARHALSHALDRREMVEVLGQRGTSINSWLTGAGAFDFPSLDAQLVRSWLARGKLGGSFHVTLAFDADRSGAEVARTLQGQWARAGLYAELRAQRGAAAAAEPLRSAAAHAQLVESQAPWQGAAAELATMVMPLRGPAIGSFRTGWRTREFDPAISPGALEPLDVEHAQQRLAEERVVLPIANLPWIWVESDRRTAGYFGPSNGPEFTRLTVPRAKPH
ncbi:MAG: ABC transporter substrate-binding protein [Candidatus Eisenbacteria bacterium]